MAAWGDSARSGMLASEPRTLRERSEPESLFCAVGVQRALPFGAGLGRREAQKLGFSIGPLLFRKAPVQWKTFEGAGVQRVATLWRRGLGTARVPSGFGTAPTVGGWRCAVAVPARPPAGGWPWGRRLRCPAERAEGGGHFVKPRVLADGAGQAVHAGIDSAEAQTVAGGVGVEVGQGAGFTALAVVADGKPEVVKLAVLLGDHRGDGADGVAAGGVFVGAQVGGVGQVAGADGAGGLVVVVGGVVVNGAVGEVALLLLDVHKAEDGMGELLLVELGLAGSG